MYWIEYKLFYVLVHIADPKFIGIKACWFGLVHFQLLFTFSYFRRSVNGASIFTTSGYAARKFQNEIEAGLVSRSFCLMSENRDLFYAGFYMP